MIESLVEKIEALNDDMVKYDKVNVQRIDSLFNECLGWSGDLMTTSPELIRRYRRALGTTVSVYAKHRCPVYGGKITAGDFDAVRGAFVVSKTDLLVKDGWYTEDFDSTESQTSGTTGPPFKYRIWNDAFVPIEQDHHYLMILKEYGLGGAAKVLHMVSGFHASAYHEVKVGRAVVRLAEKSQIPNRVARLHAGHGLEDADMYHIEFGESAYTAVHDFCKFVTEFIMKEEIDVLLASGGFFELLSSHLIADETTSFPALTRLMSNTGDWVNTDTLEFLKEAGVTHDWCDHMRCWDGGVTFFTCPHGTYHLQEDLCDVRADAEGRMISTDFFSFPSPFVNYWNGDYCSVGEEYGQCPCGRWYRPFKFLARRSRSNRNATGTYYDAQRIYDLLIKKYDVGFANFQDNAISLEDSRLSEKTKASIVTDMAKEQIAVNYFTQPSLKRYVVFGKPLSEERKSDLHSL